MENAIDAALQPRPPGRVVRALAPVFGGIRATEHQIHVYGSYWRSRALAAIESGDPLVVALGDSLSQGIGSSSPESTWVHRFGIHEAEHRGGLPAGVVNLSRSGARIDDVIDVQMPALRALEGRPLIVTCTVGSNDLVRGLSFGSAVSSMRSMMARLPADSIIATLPAKGSVQAKRLNKVIRREAPDAGLIVADVDRHLISWRGRSAGDRFHPNDLGYEAWFCAFAEAQQVSGADRIGVAQRSCS